MPKKRWEFNTSTFCQKEIENPRFKKCVGKRFPESSANLETGNSLWMKSSVKPLLWKSSKKPLPSWVAADPSRKPLKS